MRLRWKKHEKLTGLARVGAGPRGSDYTDGTIRYAVVHAHSFRHTRKEGWFWVSTMHGEHVNTCNEPGLTEQEAKDAAASYVKARLAKAASAVVHIKEM